MTNYVVESFANYDEFKDYIESLATTTDVQIVYSEKKGWTVIVG